MTLEQRNYEKLHQLSRQKRVLTGISHVLEWDQETYMPAGAGAIRGIQIETLAGLIHTEQTSKKYASALSKLIDISTGEITAKSLSAEQQAALREWRKDYIKAKALPKKFVEEWAKTTCQSMIVWREAKKTNTFSHFAPFLDKIVQLSRQKADYLGYEDHPYDALLDEYEPGANTKQISKLFGSIKASVQDLLKHIARSKPVDDSFLNGKFPTDKQMEFSKELLNRIGYTETHGRLDFSTHPFSIAPHPTDSRITTRIHPTSVMSCISVVLHEVGHALYEMGLPHEQYGTPLGDAISLGIHESQSRFWETRIGQSKPFWKYHLPLLKEKFGKELQDVSLETFYRAINKVHPTLIRVEADEVTYPLHVILRYEMEKSLIEGSLQIRDVPEVWNAKMMDLLGILPSNDAEGCLQDVHWSMGGIGYFPTYNLGNLYAAQLFEAFAVDHPDWEKRVAAGELLFIREWLGNAVHRHGRRYSGEELIKKISGKKLSADSYINYLNDKYR